MQKCDNSPYSSESEVKSDYNQAWFSYDTILNSIRFFHFAIVHSFFNEDIETKLYIISANVAHVAESCGIF